MTNATLPPYVARLVWYWPGAEDTVTHAALITRIYPDDPDEAVDLIVFPAGTQPHPQLHVGRRFIAGQAYCWDEIGASHAPSPLQAEEVIDPNDPALKEENFMRRAMAATRPPRAGVTYEAQPVVPSMLGIKIPSRRNGESK